MGGVADRVRQIATNLGARPYRVFLVWTRATGEERGEGTDQEIARVEILPTPVSESLDAITRGPFAAGAYPVGSIRLREVSTSFDFGTLSGKLLPDGRRVDTIPQPWDFYYELFEDGRHEATPEPMRFRLLSPPAMDAENVQWVMALERVGTFGGRTDIPAKTPEYDELEEMPDADNE
jgi:hypothetical protein